MEDPTLTLGDRMKQLESVPRTSLDPKLPIVIRLDGKAFHTFTKNFDKPYDRRFHELMWATAQALCHNVQNTRLAYVQSDEITIVTVPFRKESSAWFDGQVMKVSSVSASIAAGEFIRQMMIRSPEIWQKFLDGERALPSFDSRCWNLPIKELTNALIFRQNDARRNSVSAVAQAHYSHKQLHGVPTAKMQTMLAFEKGVDWSLLPTPQKFGVCIVKESYDVPRGTRTRWTIDENIPLFTSKEGRAYVESRITSEDE